MSVIRGEVNLTKLNDTQLSAMVRKIMLRGVCMDSIKSRVDGWQGGRARTMVKYATAAYDLLQEAETKTHIIPPSEETQLWSSMEGGHIYHELPKIDVMGLIKI